MQTFTKNNYTDPMQLELEALGLEWLAAAMSEGGAAVVPVISQKRGSLTTRKIPSTRITSRAAAEFGAALAVTHAAGAPSFGCVPPGWEGDGWMGRARLPLQARTPDTPGTWGEFFARDRILPSLPQALRNGSLDAAGVAIIERVAARVARGEFDVPQPSLVRGEVARTHGDLWCGNVMWSPAAEVAQWAPSAAGKGAAGKGAAGKGAAGKGAAATSEKISETGSVMGVLIDPAAQGGHGETDLAQLGVFGQPYLPEIYAGYQEVSALAPGWRERISIHQLHMVVVHAALFGGSYGAEAVALARPYL